MPRQNCNSMAVFAVTVCSVFTILVANRLAVIVHSVEYDVAMRMLTVDMSGNDVLRIFNTHQFHIVVRYVQHQGIIGL